MRDVNFQFDAGVHADGAVLRVGDAENGLWAVVEGDRGAGERVLPRELVDQRGLRQQLRARRALGESQSGIMPINYN